MKMSGETKARLMALADPGNAAFVAKLIPNIRPDRIIGARTPALRKLAKEMRRDGMAEAFLGELPHELFEENQLHAFILSDERDYGRCLAGVQAFLPWVDNWATCDQLSPRVFQKNRQELLPAIGEWMGSPHPYTVRFAVGMLMQHYLEKDFREEYPERVAALRSEEYYVNMMAAWYFATALAKQYNAVLPYLQERKLAVWTHNKAIQKALESRRITPEQKEQLRLLKARAGHGE